MAAEDGWRVYAHADLAELSLQFRDLLTREVTKVVGRSLNDFEEMSDWLVAAGDRRDGHARALRDWFKADDGVRNLLGASVLARLAEEWLDGPASLHPVVRLRTVIGGKEFTHSRPHQDAALWPEYGDHVNVWLPLVDVDERLAPLCIVMDSSTHLYEHTLNEYNQLEIIGLADSHAARHMLLKIGEVLLFRPQLVHFSANNLTDRIRWSIDCRFVKN